MATTSTSSAVLSAQAFVDSIAVNAHSAYSSSSAYASYGNSSLILDDLHYLGVTTIRDALPTDPNAAPVVNALAAAGVKFDFVVSSELPAYGAAGIAQFIASLDGFVAKYPNSIVAIEGLNEANIQSFSYNGSSSMAAAAQFQKDLYTAIKADGHLGGVSVYNLTLGLNDSAAYAQLGDLSKYSDYSSSHAYVATTTPENYGIQYGVNVAASSSPGNPSVITETGYTTLASYSGLGVDQVVQAKSILNSLVDAFKDGVSKTYLYELLDHGSGSDPEGSFGLFNVDGTPKLAATAVHNLTAILADDGSGGRTPTTPLAYTIDNLPTSGNSMVLAKSNGAYELVVWAEPQLWNDAKDTEISNPTMQAKVHLGSVHQTVTVYDPLNTSKPIATYTNVQDFTLPVSDHPLVIEIDAPTATITPAGPTDIVATSAAVVAELSDLNAAGTVKSITLTDTHVLSVSSKATMDYMMSHYAGVLSTIKGGYSFAVTTSAPTWSLTENYSSIGALTSTDQTAYVNGVTVYELVTYADGTTAASNFANGVKTQTTVTHPDGSKEVTVYGITGQSYVTMTTYTNASGAVVEKTYISADGSSIDDHFNSSGALVSETKANADGSSSTTLFTSGVKTAAFVTNADGSNDNSFYGIKGQSYTSEVQHVNAGGSVTSVVRSYADGTTAYTETHSSDGTITSTNYDAKGVKTAKAVTHTDGTKDIYALNIQQKCYASEHSHFDAAGNLTLFERFHADGSYAQKSTILGGTTVSDSYDSNGALVSELTVGADGSTSTSLFSGDVKTKMYVTHADHSQDNYAYNVTGQSFANIVQHVSASGQLTSIIRMHADGSLEYTQTVAADGTKTSTQYDAHGTKLAQTITHSDGSTVNDTFNAFGQVTKDIVTNADGSSSTSLFVDGVRTKMYVLNADHSQDNYAYGVVGQSYVNVVQHTDAAGKLTSAMRTHADGTLDYTLATGSDGTTTAAYYDAKGVMGSKVVTQTTGAKDVFTFLSTGVQDQSYSASGVLQKTDLLKADGTHVETANAAGVTLRAGIGNDVFASDGSATFVFDRGNDQIQNFHAGAAADHDVIKISQSLVTDYSHLSVTQAGADAVVHLGDAGSILLAHINAAQLTHDNFLFV
ncbi:RHS repeat protein [Bradyrhizobium sp. CCBAU 53340]|uniref:RHS repeat protein n=1 Tax=Bradyrhizobium sp. CCBAU 53340 TaxID=1325112 RepID=UPI00188CB891|nr:RHS repeat protein [Bradyrhizobium sp. CCBAU 53340]QOZ47332.1 RHS repeat protein [Bradyrhizobium sp. CCBAU 53340]